MMQLRISSISKFLISFFFKTFFKDLLNIMLQDNMGASQFLKDFRMEYKVKKNAELRKTVTQLKEKRQEKNDSVPFKVKNLNLLILENRLWEFIWFSFSDTQTS